MKTSIKTALLALTILLPALASAHDFEVDGIYYNINGNEATVTYQGMNPSQYVEYSGQVVIPEAVTHDGITYPVTAIGDGAFERCNNLTGVEIPNTVTSIGNYVFDYDSRLTSIVIPNSVTTIGNGAFSYCDGMTNVTIGNSVRSIGTWTFSGCSSLTGQERICGLFSPAARRR